MNELSGVEVSAGIYNLIETAKANGLNPRKYIQYILGDIPGSAETHAVPGILGRLPSMESYHSKNMLITVNFQD